MKFLKLSFVLLILGTTTVVADTVTLPNGIIEQRNIQYVPGGDAAQTLDLYLPSTASDRPLPIIVWVHGGGWQGGSKDWCPSAQFVGQGFAAASVEYRFSQKALFPAQIQDCQAAIRWTRANCKTYNIDPRNVGVWGNSAGGHLVALLGTSGGKHAFPEVGGNEKQSDRVQAVCDEYGPSDFGAVMAQAALDPTKSIFNFNHGDPYSNLIGVPLGSDPAKDAAVSPVTYVSKDNPPFLILQGKADSLVPFAQSQELADDLQKSGVDVLLQPFPGAGHGDKVIDNNPAVTQLVKTFFDNNLRKQKVVVKLLPDSVVTAMPAAATP